MQEEEESGSASRDTMRISFRRDVYVAQNAFKRGMREDGCQRICFDIALTGGGNRVSAFIWKSARREAILLARTRKGRHVKSDIARRE